MFEELPRIHYNIGKTDRADRKVQYLKPCRKETMLETAQRTIDSRKTSGAERVTKTESEGDLDADPASLMKKMKSSEYHLHPSRRAYSERWKRKDETAGKLMLQG